MDLENLDPESPARVPDPYPSKGHPASPAALSQQQVGELETAPTRVALIVLGLGRVGRAFLRQLLRHARLHEEVYGIIFDVVAVSDSTAALLLEGMSQLESIVDWKEATQQFFCNFLLAGDSP